MSNARKIPTLGLSLPATSNPASCPCGSGTALVDCCGPIHADHSKAFTAEQLMRARYSAFALRRRTFLEASWHPSTRPAQLDVDDDTEWLGLTITQVIAGGPQDRAGEVAFIARLRDPSEPSDAEQRLVEHSRFVREDGLWLYLDAIT